jgi:hypothetical protein
MDRDNNDTIIKLRLFKAYQVQRVALSITRAPPAASENPRDTQKNSSLSYSSKNFQINQMIKKGPL